MADYASDTLTTMERLCREIGVKAGVEGKSWCPNVGYLIDLDFVPQSIQFMAADVIIREVGGLGLLKETRASEMIVQTACRQLSV